jgi:hypothetical protein
MFSTNQKNKHELLKALDTLNIPFSAFIWSDEDSRVTDYEGLDNVDKRINQFLTKQHILQAYRNKLEALKERDKDFMGNYNDVCVECLNACVRSRDKLLDTAKKIQFARNNINNPYSPSP